MTTPEDLHRFMALAQWARQLPPSFPIIAVELVERLADAVETLVQEVVELRAYVDLLDNNRCPHNAYERPVEGCLTCSTIVDARVSLTSSGRER